METKNLHDKDIYDISHYIKKYFNSIPEGELTYTYAPEEKDVIKQIHTIKSHNSCIVYSSATSQLLAYDTELNMLMLDDEHSFLKMVKQCIRRYRLTIIPLAIFDKVDGGHLNILIIKDGVVYFFEPQINIYARMVKLLQEYFYLRLGLKSKGIGFPSHIGLQTIEINKHENSEHKLRDDEGYCVAWGLLIVDLVQKFPHVKLHVLLYIVANVLDFEPEKFRIFIEKYALWLYKRAEIKYGK